MRKQLRNCFGISAHRVAVRTHLPWHWRALSVVFLVGAALILGGWLYAAGHQMLGFGRRDGENDLSSMRGRVMQLEAELESARKVASSSESRLQIEVAAQERLATQIKTLEEENTRLKIDVAMFEHLAGGHAGDAGLAMSQLQVLPSSAEGEYRYRLMLVQTGDKKQQETKGKLQLIATILRGTSTSTMPFPVAGDSGANADQISFRYFRRFDGVFTVPAGTKLKRLEARFIKDGVIKASQTVVL